MLVGADGIRSAVRGQRLPDVRVIDAGVRGLGVYGRSPLTPEVRDSLPALLLQGVIIAADRRGSRMLLAAFQPRRPAPRAAAELAPDVTLEPVGDYLMVSCSVAPGTVIPPAGEWAAAPRPCSATPCSRPSAAGIPHCARRGLAGPAVHADGRGP